MHSKSDAKVYDVHIMLFSVTTDVKTLDLGQNSRKTGKIKDFDRYYMFYLQKLHLTDQLHNTFDYQPYVDKIMTFLVSKGSNVDRILTFLVSKRSILTNKGKNLWEKVKIDNTG